MKSRGLPGSTCCVCSQVVWSGGMLAVAWCALCDNIALAESVFRDRAMQLHR